MRLFLLKHNLKLWEDTMDTMRSCVVRAVDESEARKIASANHGDEGENVWLSSFHTSCEPINGRGRKELIVRDYRAG